MWYLLQASISTQQSTADASHALALLKIVTTDPTNMKAILATDFTSFGKSTRFRDMLSNFLGDAVFTSDGEEWKRVSTHPISCKHLSS